MKVLIKKLLRSPLFTELVIAVAVAVYEMATAPEQKPKGTRPRPGA
jgi:hypothetical protein